MFSIHERITDRVLCTLYNLGELAAAARDGRLRGADLSGVQELRGADLSNASFRHTDLAGADLTNANLLDVKMSGACLSNTRGVIDLGHPNGWRAFGWLRDGYLSVRVGCREMRLAEGRRYWKWKKHRREVMAALDYAEKVAKSRGWRTAKPRAKTSKK